MKQRLRNAVFAFAAAAAIVVCAYIAFTFIFKSSPPEFAPIRTGEMEPENFPPEISDFDVQGVQPDKPYKVMIAISRSVPFERLYPKPGDKPAAGTGESGGIYFYVCNDDGTNGKVVLHHEEQTTIGFTDLLPWQDKVIAAIYPFQSMWAQFYWLRIIDPNVGTISEPVVINEEHSYKKNAGAPGEFTFYDSDFSRTKYVKNPFISMLPIEIRDALNLPTSSTVPKPPKFGGPQVAGKTLFATADVLFKEERRNYVFATRDTRLKKIGKAKKIRFAGKGGEGGGADLLPGNRAAWHGPVSSKAFLMYVDSYALAGGDDERRRCELRVLNANTGTLSKLATIGFRGDEDSGFEIALIAPGEPYGEILECPVKLYSAMEFWQLADGRAIGKVEQNVFAGPEYIYPGFPVFDFENLDVDYMPYPGGYPASIIKLFDYRDGIIMYGIVEKPVEEGGTPRDSPVGTPSGQREIWRYERKTGEWTLLGERRHYMPLFISHDGTKMCVLDLRYQMGLSPETDARPIEAGMIDLTHPDLPYERLPGLPDVPGVTQGVVRIGG